MDIEEALERVGYYSCPECGEELIVRHGDIRIWHFAHSSFGSVKSECPLRTEQDVKDWEDEFKISPIEKDEKERVIRSIIMFDPYNEKFDLYGIIPTANYDEFPDIEQIDQCLGETVVNCVDGVRGTIPSTEFNPNRVEVKIPLEIGASKYEIGIESNLPSINGVWSANPISEKDVFVGNETTAEIKRQNYRFRIGDRVYIVFGETPEKNDNELTYRFGEKYLLSFDVGLSTFPRLKEILNLTKDTLDENIFYVDLILPAEIHPNPLEPVEGTPNSHTLISIIPPKHLDPTFEIINIPFDDRVKKKDKTGPGKPRYLLEYFLEERPKRISIYWGRRHRTLILSPNSEYKRENYLATGKELDIGIKVTNGGETTIICPWSTPSKLTVEKEKILSEGVNIEFLGPQDLSIDLEGYGDKKVYRLNNIGISDILPLIETWIEEDIQKILLSYSALGRIIIEINEVPDEAPLKVATEVQIIEVYFDPDVIKDKLIKMKTFPKKIRWTHVKMLLDIDKETAHSRLPGGLKKRIRKIHAEVKKEGRIND